MSTVDTDITAPDARIVCAVVIYGTRLSECEVYETLIKDNLDTIDCLLVFDNSPQRLYEEIRLGKGRYEYFWNPDNPGVAANYNRAAAFARDNGYGWVLLSDQDTSFPPGALAAYREAIAAKSGCRLFAPKHKTSLGCYISPAKVFRRLPSTVAAGTYPLRTYDVINSGLLVSVGLFWEAGGYKEDVSLDFSDFQFLERVRRFEPAVEVLGIECLQNFSNEVSDRRKLISRFRIFCRCAARFETDSLRSRLKIAFITLKHTAALAVRCRTLGVFGILINAMTNKNSNV